MEGIVVNNLKYIQDLINVRLSRHNLIPKIIQREKKEKEIYIKLETFDTRLGNKIPSDVLHFTRPCKLTQKITAVKIRFERSLNWLTNLSFSRYHL